MRSIPGDYRWSDYGLLPFFGAMLLLAATLGPSTSAAAAAGSMAAALESIRIDQIDQHIDYLADDERQGREAGQPGGRAAGDYLVDKLKTLELEPAGLDGGYFQPFGTYRNVLARIEGSDPKLKDEYVLIAAHYDHIGLGKRGISLGTLGKIHNGADDNASGTAAVLELAEAFSFLPKAPRRSILLVFWDAEEKGLLGSYHWLAEPTVPIDRVVLMLNIDMIGRLRDEGLHVFGSRSAYGLRHLLTERNREAQISLDFDWRLTANADHYPFVERGVPAMMLHTGLHDQYHRETDDPELINSAGLQRVTRLLLETVVAVANAPERPAFREASRHESNLDRDELARPYGGLASRLGVRWRDKSKANDTGLRVTEVDADSPAARADIRVGDRLLRFADRDVRTTNELIWAIASARSPAEVELERDEEPTRLEIEMPGKPIRLGISWREDEAEPDTLVITRVTPGSPAEVAGLLTGDRLHRLDGTNLSEGIDFAPLVRQLPDRFLMVIERRGRLRTLTIHLVPARNPDAV